MDILAHSLWAGMGAAVVARHWKVSRRQIGMAMAFAALPDIGHLMPIAAWGLVGDGTWSALAGYAIATPGAEPALPPGVQLWSHTLHCLLHSAVVAAAVTAAALAWRRSLAIPLAGWWSHILIDVLTHSRDYYPSPVLYPFTEAGFDGIAWPTPWFMAANYTALAIAAFWLLHGSRKTDERPSEPADR